MIPRELKSRDKRSLLQTVMSQWLPLSHATLLTVVQKVPDPIKCQAIKVPSIISNDQKSEQVDDIIRESMKCNNSEAAPLVCFLSKVFSVAESDLPIMAATKEETQLADDARRLAIARSIARQNERDLGVPIEIPDTAQDVGSHPENVLIGLVRIYSGIIKVGQSVYILNPKYNANDPNFYHYYSTMTVERLFILMGKELHNINEVSAGNVFGIMCSNTEILKTATLTSTLACPSLACLSTNSPPILQVAVTPKDPSKLPQLIKGLELLEKADTCAEVFLNDIGEYVLVCAGELHVEVR